MPGDGDGAHIAASSRSNGQSHPEHTNALSSLLMPVVTVPTSVLLGDGTTSPLVVAGLATRAALESQRVGDLPGAMQCTILAEDAHRYGVLAAITIPAMQYPEELGPGMGEPQQDRLLGIDADDDDDFATAGFVVTGASSWPNEEEAAPAPSRRNPSPKRRAGVKLSNGRG
jgi:hypothetical protein